MAGGYKATGLNVELIDGTNVELKLQAFSTIDDNGDPKTIYEIEWGSTQNSVWTPKIDPKELTKDQASSQHSFDLKVQVKKINDVPEYAFTPTVDKESYATLVFDKNIRYISIRNVSCYTPAGTAFPNGLRMQHKVLKIRQP